MGDPAYRGKLQDALAARARERLEHGQLPGAKAARTWGGRGSGLPCSLCDIVILETEPEMELEFDGSTNPHVVRFHLPCHSAWDAVRRALPPGEDWTSIDHTLPPFDAVVEARLAMQGGRPVILGVVRTRSGDKGAVWMNATTHLPLPASWSPLEWRFPLGLESPEQPAKSSAPKRA
jgi:hypothetical protein